jgi:hypothetical protein
MLLVFRASYHTLSMLEYFIFHYNFFDSWIAIVSNNLMENAMRPYESNCKQKGRDRHEFER